MGTPLRKPTPPLAETIYQETYNFEFVQIVRILNSLNKETTPLGEGVNPQKESVFFKSNVSFAFSPSDLSRLTYRENGPPILHVNFLGIAGAQGPLPAPYAHTLMERVNVKDTAFRDFLDIFNHRLISLLYRIRKKHRPYLSDTKASHSSIGKLLHTFLGLGFDDPSLSEQFSIPDSALIGMAGLFWKTTPSKVGLEKILTHYFKVPVSIQDFKGKWVSFPDSQTSKIGAIQGQYNILGQSAVLGNSFWDKVGAITISLGPLSLPQFILFFQAEQAYQNLCDLTTFYLGRHITFDLNLIIKKEEVPALTLGKESYLAWRTWLKTQPFPHDDAHVYVHPRTSDIF